MENVIWKMSAILSRPQCVDKNINRIAYNICWQRVLYMKIFYELMKTYNRHVCQIRYNEHGQVITSPRILQNIITYPYIYIYIYIYTHWILVHISPTLVLVLLSYWWPGIRFLKVINNFNSLWSVLTTWHWESWPTFGQAMACCQIASGHYPNWCWLMVKWTLRN